MANNLQILLNEAASRGLNLLKTYRVDELQADVAIKTSRLGTPVYSNLEIQSGAYQDAAGNTVEYPGLIIDEVLMVISQEKIIKRTMVNGRTGTVKEFISDGDYYVQIDGVIVSDYRDVYPQQDVNNLISICKVPAAIKVTSTFLQQFGVYELVISNYRFHQKQGYRNVQPFSLQCYSDEPFEIQKRKEQ